ncbi:lipoprotein [Spiroplasma endosymbiont of Ammophila pubescens]|uniref:lipoprotein n=1 Tax=Spiroplasma endosymbiont of Ammophila pubescens TaxID=3066315 RepID=UPI0032B137E9
MKKILSILGVIGLITSTTTLISCEKPNNNENGGNKPEPWYNPQQPPENSNWKLITTIENVDKYKWEDKTYIGITKIWKNHKWNWIIEDWKLHPPFSNVYLSNYKAIYRWNGVNEP